MDNYSFQAWSANREQEIKNGCWHQILPATLLFQEVVQGSLKRVKARHPNEAWYEEVLYFDMASSGAATMHISLWPFKFHPDTNYMLSLRVLLGPVSPTSSPAPTFHVELKPGFTTPSSSYMDEWRISHSSIVLDSIEFSVPFSVDAIVLRPETKVHYGLPPPSKPLSSISDDVKPLRLIDIEKTLHSHGGVVFKQAQRWDFCVISHTWSEEIRAFSKIIADINKQSGFTSSYEELFQEGDFSAEPAYNSLMEFFKILRSDNVKDVWFDALCINQRDDEEKGREIAHMGAYYKHSDACYVVKHGIGKGYKLATRHKSGGYGIARWFSRAWTFQEYVLPQRMIFLTDCIPKRVQRMVNYCINSTAHSFVCECSLSEIEQTLLSVLDNLEFFDPNAEVVNDIIGSDIDVRCDKCGNLPYIRRVKLTRLGCKTTLYFIDREFYGFLLSCFHHSIICADDYMNHVCLPAGNQAMLQSKSLPAYGSDGSWIGRVYALQRVVKNHDIGRGEGFFLDGMKGRDATNEEDKVLSILALMGMEGSMQVRTGKNLSNQYVQLARIASPHLLVEICINCMHPHEDGISWIPVSNIIAHIDLPMTHPPFQTGRIRATVQKEKVTAEGYLGLCGKATRARLMFDPSSIHLHDASSCASFCMPCHSTLTGMGGPCPCRCPCPCDGSAQPSSADGNDTPSSCHSTSNSEQGPCPEKDDQISGLLSHAHIKCLIEAASVHPELGLNCSGESCNWS